MNTTVRINNIDFVINKLPALLALRLDKIVIQMLIPVLGSVDGLNLDAEINPTMMFSTLSDCLSNLSEDDFTRFFKDLFSTIQVRKDNNNYYELTDDAAFNKTFEDTITIYRLAFEVMKFNKFSPFALAGGGNLMSKITGLKEVSKSVEENSEKSEMSENSVKN